MERVFTKNSLFQQIIHIKIIIVDYSFKLIFYIKRERESFYQKYSFFFKKEKTYIGDYIFEYVYGESFFSKIIYFKK